MISRRVCWVLAVGLSLFAGCEKKRDADPSFDGVRLEDLAPSEGFGYRIGPFSVPYGQAVQDCHFVAVPDLNGDGSDVFINAFSIGMNPGSHHFNVFRVKTIVNLDGAPGTVVHGTDPGEACWDSANWSDWPLVVNNQASTFNDPYFDWQLPESVAQRFSPGEKLMLQTHYTNTGDQATPFDGYVAINFYRSPDAAPMEMGSLFATQQNIRICQSNPSVKYAGTCSFPASQVAHISAANGHFHWRGKQFQIFDWDGVTPSEPPLKDRFYNSTQWAEPPMFTGLDVVPPSGGGIYWTCEYQWVEPQISCDEVNALDPLQQGDCCYTFGPHSDYQEHCNVFLYYYPKSSESIFCN